MDNQTDSKTVATSKWRRSPKRTKYGVDLHDTLNAKQNQEGDLRAKLNGRKAAAVSKVVFADSMICTARNEQMEVAPRYHTSSSQEFKGLNPPKKFIPPRFSLYDGKSDPRFHISHVRQNDGLLKLYGRSDMPRVPIKSRGSQAEMFRQNTYGVD